MSPTTRRHRLRARYEHHRARLDAYPRLRFGYKLLVGVVGVLVVALGLVLVPLPGPGWLVVFVGVAVLGTEFPAAHRVTEFVRRQLRRARTWWRARRVARSAARDAAATGAPRPAPRASTDRAPSV